MIRNRIFNFLEFSHFSQFSIVFSALFYKNIRFEKHKLVVSLKVIELQRCTIPHFKALDPLFSALA